MLITHVSVFSLSSLLVNGFYAKSYPSHYHSFEVIQEKNQTTFYDLGQNECIISKSNRS